MTTIDQTTRKDAAGEGFTGLLKSGAQAGLGVAEYMHQVAVEIPLNMLSGIGVSDEQTSALKDKHRNLLRVMYGSIDSITSQFIDAGRKQADLLGDGLGDLAQPVDVPEAKEQQGTGDQG